MSEQKKAYLNCTSDVVCGLVNVLNLALVDKFPSPRADIEDIEQLFDTLRLLGPEVAGFEIFEGLLHIVRHDLITAKQIFRSLVERRLYLPNSKALLMYCMSANGDANWIIEANQLMEGETDATVLQLVQAVMANEDFKRAAEEAKLSGHFETPESVKKVIDEYKRREAQRAESAQPVPTGTIDPALIMDGQYLRL